MRNNGKPKQLLLLHLSQHSFIPLDTAQVGMEGGGLCLIHESLFLTLHPNRGHSAAPMPTPWCPFQQVEPPEKGGHHDTQKSAQLSRLHEPSLLIS